MDIFSLLLRIQHHCYTWLLLILLITESASLKMKKKSSKKFRKYVAGYGGRGISNEHILKQNILNFYDITTRPVKSDGTPVQVSVAISLYHILDTDEKHQTFECLLSIRQRWNDEYLSWNESDYGGLKSIRLPANQIWTPDLVISNYADENFNDRMVTNVIINNDGNVLWMIPALVKTYCALNVQYFPFDTQKCQLSFISWTYSGFELNIIYNESFANSIYYNPENQEWWVENITSVRHVQKYACCDEPYPDVTFTINMRRRSQFYVFNMIYPCVLIYLISYLGFFLPVESGEKVNLEITILLALVVFLLMVAETMPPTPDSIPVLGMFYGATMLMVSVALVMAVIVTNLSMRHDTHQKVPTFLRKILLVMSGPGKGKHKSRNRQNRRDRITKAPSIRLEMRDIKFNGEVETKHFSPAHCVDDMNNYHLEESDSEKEEITDYNYMACQSAFCCFRRTLRRHDSDWQVLATVVDNLLFWLYVVMSLSVFVPIFMTYADR
ncbi:unnamed protein product [Owenia fusiformis]|uniref:Uncharacterized protein n=1 Tax=Owenia fusiformis TaxID=6347 RepID=A0A8J1U3U0_OWEFU|nr:unnamed protein product [Owenia fusiformis]